MKLSRTTVGVVLACMLVGCGNTANPADCELPDTKLICDEITVIQDGNSVTKHIEYDYKGRTFNNDFYYIQGTDAVEYKVAYTDGENLYVYENNGYTIYVGEITIKTCNKSYFEHNIMDNPIENEPVWGVD